MQRKRLSIVEFDHHVISLLQRVYDSTYVPDLIVPVLKGGAIPAFTIAQFHNPVWYSAADVERHGEERDVLFPMEPFLSYDITGWDVLVVEDDNITGKGLEAVCKAIEKRGAKPKTAALFVSERTAKSTDFYSEIVDDFQDYPFKPFHSGNREHLVSKPYLIPLPGSDLSLNFDYLVSFQPFGQYYERLPRCDKMDGVDRSRIAPRAVK